MQRSFWLAATCAASLLLLAPAGASADTYTVTSCHDPQGAPNAAAGWVSSATGHGAVANNCALLGGGLSAVLTTAKPAGNSSANWRFTAPAGTRIVGVAAQRATFGLGPSSEPQDVAYLMRTDTALLESCAPSPTSSCVGNLTLPLAKQGLSGSWLEMRVLCTNAGAACTRPIGVNAPRIYIALEDSIAPTVTRFRVVDNGESSGRLRVRYDAADVGGGLYRTLIKVDGKVTQAIPLAGAPCADVNPTDGDPYQFNVPVPCPGAVKDVLATVDVRNLSPGPHGVEIAVEDAAGNQTAVYGPVEFPRLNATGSSLGDAAALLNARLRMWFVKAPNRGRRYTSRYGTRVVTRGTLRTRRGRGVRGAEIDVYHIRRDGRRRLVKTGLKSRRFGRLTLILPNNLDTRTIEYAYRAVRPGPITSRVRLRLTVLRNGRVFFRPTRRR